jgi:transposase
MTDEDKKNELIETLLEERDHLYRETVRLKTALKEASNIESYKNTIEELTYKNNYLQSVVEYLQRKIWGKSSERYIHPDPLQRTIDFDGLDILLEEQAEAEKAGIEVRAYKKEAVVRKETGKPFRQPLAESLPREEEHIYPENINPTSGEWTELPPVITEVLSHKPALFYVRRIIRHVYALKGKNTVGEQKAIVSAAMPVLPIAKSYADASLLAELMVNKYVHHLPFHRQIKMFSQLGVTLSSSTINDWFKETADLIRPLYYCLREQVLGTDYIQVDETTIPIINNDKQKTVRSYLWMVRSVMENTLFFHYDEGSRAQKVVARLLKDYQGALQTDGYEVYQMYENKKGVLPIGCWAHVRRKFDEARKEDEARAGYALGQIGMLYDIERMADDQRLSYEERAALRIRLAYPLMVVFEKWIYNEIPKVLPKGRIGKALRYTYNIFHKLTRYHLDGRYRMDNNLAENAIRPVALGRKNYLFCGNHSAAEDAAVFYSLLGCCNAIDVNFRDWLIFVLNHVHEYDNDYSKDLAELLPEQLKKNNHI